MFIQLNQVKKHLNIDEDFNDDDKYLCDLIDVVEKVVGKHIDDNLDKLCEANGGVLPSPLAHAMLILIADLYANRESVSYTSIHELPTSYKYLLSLYRNYNNKEV